MLLKSYMQIAVHALLISGMTGMVVVGSPGFAQKLSFVFLLFPYFFK